MNDIIGRKIVTTRKPHICSWLAGRLWNCEVIGNIFDNPELLEAK